jgi:hypothetical protein
LKAATASSRVKTTPMLVREDFGRASSSVLSWIIVAFWIAAIVSARIQTEDLRSGTRLTDQH